jgi:HEAT repeat protein
LIERGNCASRVACRALEHIGDNAKAGIPSLLLALKNDDPFLVTEAAKTLWTISGQFEDIQPALAKLLESTKSGTAEAACDVVHVIGPAAAPLVEHLLKALTIEDWDLQWAAADALGSIAAREPEVISALIIALGHKSNIVCGAAARALSAIGEKAIPSLLQAAQEGDDDRRAWAIDLLGHLGPQAKAAVKPLKKLLGSKNLHLRNWGAIALGKIASLKDVVPILVEIIEKPEYPDMQSQAFEAIGNIGAAAQAAIPTLRKMLIDGTDNLQAAAKDALEKIDDTIC